MGKSYKKERCGSKYRVRDYVMVKLDRMEQKQKLNAPYTGPF